MAKRKTIIDEFNLSSFKDANYIVFVAIVVLVLAIVISKTSVIQDKFPLNVVGTFYGPTGGADILGTTDPYSGLKTIGQKKGVSMMSLNVLYTNHGEEQKIERVYIESLEDCTATGCVKSLAGSLRGFWAEAFAGQTLPWSEATAVEVAPGTTKTWTTGKICVDLNYCHAKSVYEGTHTYKANIASIKEGGVKELVTGKYIVTFDEDPMGTLHVSISYDTAARCLLDGSVCDSTIDVCCFSVCNTTMTNTTMGYCGMPPEVS